MIIIQQNESGIINAIFEEPHYIYLIMQPSQYLQIIFLCMLISSSASQPCSLNAPETDLLLLLQSITQMLPSLTSASQIGVSCVGARCPNSCVVVQNCQASSGEMVGETCFMCDSGQTIRNGQCVQQVTCGPLMSLDVQKCVCDDGYVMVNNMCYQVCGVNSYLFNSECICIPGYTFSNVFNTCVLQSQPVCPNNSLPVGNTCICKAGLGMFNGRCVACPINGKVDTNGKCLCGAPNSPNPQCNHARKCGPNQVYNLSTALCACKPGTHRLGLDCIACHQNSYFNGSKCVCQKGYYLSAGECIICPVNGKVDRYGNCLCGAPNSPNPQCLPPPAQCLPNQVFDSSIGRCVCQPGRQRVENICVWTQPQPT